MHSQPIAPKDVDATAARMHDLNFVLPTTAAVTTAAISITNVLTTEINSCTLFRNGITVEKSCIVARLPSIENTNHHVPKIVMLPWFQVFLCEGLNGTSKNNAATMLGSR